MNAHFLPYLTMNTVWRLGRLLCASLLLGTMISQSAFLVRADRFDEDPDSPEVCTEIFPPSIGAAAATNLLWQGKSELKVGFLNGSDVLKNQVTHYATYWNQYSKLQIVFVETGPSDIRVSIDSDGTFWSYVGRSAEAAPKNEATMHFGWSTGEKTPEEVFRRTVLHEFGHALGLIHEQQSPQATLAFNKPAVYAYYKNKFGWNKNKVDQNFFRKVPKAQARYTPYDPASIMHYHVPATFTLDGRSVPWNTHLSKRDIDLIKKLYH